MSTKTWRIPVEWKVCDTVEIEASTLEEAIKTFESIKDDLPLGDDPQYIDGSYKMTSGYGLEDISYLFNNGHK